MYKKKNITVLQIYYDITVSLILFRCWKWIGSIHDYYRWLLYEPAEVMWPQLMGKRSAGPFVKHHPLALRDPSEPCFIRTAKCHRIWAVHSQMTNGWAYLKCLRWFWSSVCIVYDTCQTVGFLPNVVVLWRHHSCL